MVTFLNYNKILFRLKFNVLKKLEKKNNFLSLKKKLFFIRYRESLKLQKINKYFLLYSKKNNIKKYFIFNFFNIFFLGNFCMFYYSIYSIFLNKKGKNRIFLKSLRKKNIFFKNQKLYSYFYNGVLIKSIVKIFTKVFNNPKLFINSYFLLFLGLNYSRIDLAIKCHGFSKLSNFYFFPKVSFENFGFFIDFLYFKKLNHFLLLIYSDLFTKHYYNNHIRRYDKIKLFLPLRGQRTRTNFKNTTLRSKKIGLILNEDKFFKRINKLSYIKEDNGFLIRKKIFKKINFFKQSSNFKKKIL